MTYDNYLALAVDNEGMISPTDLALLDTLMKGGTALSLKVFDSYCNNLHLV